MSFLRRLVKASTRSDPTQRALGYLRGEQDKHPAEPVPVKKTGREKFAEFLRQANRR